MIRRRVLVPGGSTAFRSDSNSSMLTHPARARPGTMLRVHGRAGTDRDVGTRLSRGRSGVSLSDHIPEVVCAVSVSLRAVQSVFIVVLFDVKQR